MQGGQFTAGGLAYGVLEIFWRGYTHISMILTGGLCFLLLLQIARSKRNLLVLCIEGGSCITAVEFLVGCVVNLWLSLDIWDYSGERLNLLGQICLRYFILWCLLCVLILPLCRLLQNCFLPKEKVAADKQTSAVL